jgi:hypothetical protein
MSVFSIKPPRRRLPDQVTIDFGPSELLGRAFIALDKACRQRGIYLSVNHDMGELAEANAQNRQHWYPLPPMFDVANGGLSADNAFWICGVNEQGEVVMTNAARLYSWPDTTLADEFESMRFFYTDPERQRAPNESCLVESNAAHEISGRVCYGGAIWVRPDYRGFGLAHFAPRLARAYALTRWYPDYLLGLVNTASASGSKAAQTYGWPNVSTGVRMCGAHKYGEEVNFAFGWFEPHDVIDDLDQYTSLLGDAPRELVV